MDADRVRYLADDLLEIARLESSQDLNLEPVPPGELVRQTVRGLGRWRKPAASSLKPMSRRGCRCCAPTATG